MPAPPVSTGKYAADARIVEALVSTTTMKKAFLRPAFMRSQRNEAAGLTGRMTKIGGPGCGRGISRVCETGAYGYMGEWTSWNLLLTHDTVADNLRARPPYADHFQL